MFYYSFNIYLYNILFIINDKKIEFTYDYLFKNKGKYIIKYKFKNY